MNIKTLKRRESNLLSNILFFVMRWVLGLTFVLVTPLLVQAQFEIEDLVSIPKTPEAAAFTDYANSASV